MTIKAGEEWVGKTITVKWMRDLFPGDVITCDSLTINGKHPEPGEMMCQDLRDMIRSHYGKNKGKL